MKDEDLCLIVEAVKPPFVKPGEAIDALTSLQQRGTKGRILSGHSDRITKRCRIYVSKPYSNNEDRNLNLQVGSCTSKQTTFTLVIMRIASIIMREKPERKNQM